MARAIGRELDGLDDVGGVATELGLKLALLKASNSYVIESWIDHLAPIDGRQRGMFVLSRFWPTSNSPVLEAGDHRVASA
jgi:hypothetical protein